MVLLVLRIHFSCHLYQSAYSSKISLHLFCASTQVICLLSWPSLFTCAFPPKSRAHHFNSFMTLSAFLSQRLHGSTSWKPSRRLQRCGSSPLFTQPLSWRPLLTIFRPWAGHSLAVHTLCHGLKDTGRDGRKGQHTATNCQGGKQFWQLWPQESSARGCSVLYL